MKSNSTARAVHADCRGALGSRCLAGRRRHDAGASRL